MEYIIPIAIQIHGHSYIEVNTVDEMIADAVDKELNKYEKKVLDAMEDHGR